MKIFTQFFSAIDHFTYLSNFFCNDLGGPGLIKFTRRKILGFGLFLVTGPIITRSYKFFKDWDDLFFFENKNQLDNALRKHKGGGAP